MCAAGGSGPFAVSSGERTGDGELTISGTRDAPSVGRFPSLLAVATRRSHIHLARPELHTYRTPPIPELHT